MSQATDERSSSVWNIASAHIASFLDHVDAARLAQASQTIHAQVASDLVWRNRLPPVLRMTKDSYRTFGHLMQCYREAQSKAQGRLESMHSRLATASRVINSFELVLIFVPFAMGPLAVTICLLASLSSDSHLCTRVVTGFFMCLSLHNIVKTCVIHSIRGSRNVGLLVRHWFQRIEGIVAQPDDTSLGLWVDLLLTGLGSLLASAKANNLIQTDWFFLASVPWLGVALRILCLGVMARDMRVSIKNLSSLVIKLALYTDMALIMLWAYRDPPFLLLTIFLVVVNLLLLLAFVTLGSIATITWITNQQDQALLDAFLERNPRLHGFLCSAWTLATLHFVLGTYAIVAWENVLLITLTLTTPAIVRAMTGYLAMPSSLSGWSRLALTTTALSFWLCLWIVLILWTTIAVRSFDDHVVVVIVDSIVQTALLACFLLTVLGISSAIIVRQTARQAWDDANQSRQESVAETIRMFDPLNFSTPKLLEHGPQRLG